MSVFCSSALVLELVVFYLTDVLGLHFLVDSDETGMSGPLCCTGQALCRDAEEQRELCKRGRASGTSSSPFLLCGGPRLPLILGPLPQEAYRGYYTHDDGLKTFV